MYSSMDKSGQEVAGSRQLNSNMFEQYSFFWVKCTIVCGIFWPAPNHCAFLSAPQISPWSFCAGSSTDFRSPALQPWPYTCFTCVPNEVLAMVHFFLLRANHRIFLIKIENLRGKEIILFLELHHKISLGSYGFWLYLRTSLASEEEFVSVVIFIFEYSLRIYVAPKRHIDMSPVMARTMFVCSAHSSIKTTPHPSQSKPTHNPFFSADLYFGNTRCCANCL